MEEEKQDTVEETKIDDNSNENNNINNNNDNGNSENKENGENNTTVLNNEVKGKAKGNNKKNIIIICLIAIIILGVIFNISNNKKNNTENYNINIGEIPVIKYYNVKIHIDFTENLVFSKYNVILSIGNKKETLNHGENKDIEISLEEGNYSLIFVNSENSSIKNETTIDVKNDMEIGYKIKCYSDRISVENIYTDVNEEIKQDELKMKNNKSEYVYKNYKEVIKNLENLGFTNIKENPMYDIIFGITEEGEVDNVTINGSDTYKRGDIFKKDTEVVVSYHLKKENDPSRNNENTNKENINTSNENQTNTENNTANVQENNNKETYNFFTTNDNETAKKGNYGKFSYVKKGKEYNIYWIIDFNEGYVYNFTEGNGETTYERIKIKSGNLNDGVELSYKDSSNAWARYLHFKYKNQPHQLVIVDNDYFEHEFSTTSLKDALKMMESKTILEP